MPMGLSIKLQPTKYSLEGVSFTLLCVLRFEMVIAVIIVKPKSLYRHRPVLILLFDIFTTYVAKVTIPLGCDPINCY